MPLATRGSEVLRFLIDTNVLISSEPTRHDLIEQTTAASLDLARVVSGQHQLLVHPTAHDEISRDQDAARRLIRTTVIARYPVLEHPPAVQPGVAAVIGDAPVGSHDWFDHQLLAAVVGDAVHGLITQDDGIHRKARHLGIAGRVHTVADALSMLSQLSNAPAEFIPSVDFRPMHAIDVSAPFFDSLRDDYAGFDDWFARSSRDGRGAFVVDGPAGETAGICILKDGDDELGLGGRVAKVSTLKVSDQFKGSRYGELLLKALFRHATHHHDALWLTVFDKHTELIALLEAFGFEQRGDVDGERRYAKRLTAATEDRNRLDALDFHIRFGPPAVKIVAGQTFITPIQPHFHTSLFPDAPGEQTSLFAPRPHGNALRKAYLCRANLRTQRPGATLLFYRSEDLRAVTTVGVLEESITSADPDELMEFVGTRTVYTAEEVAAMARRGEVLAILFRQDRFLDPPIPIAGLVQAGVVLRAPQTTIAVRPEGIEWISERLAE